jgi:hypothetical protein
MLFGGIVVKECLQVVDEVVFVVGDLQIGHYYIVGSVSPVALSLVVDPVGLAGKVQSLQYELAVLLQQWTPLH